MLQIIILIIIEYEHVENSSQKLIQVSVPGGGSWPISRHWWPHNGRTTRAHSAGNRYIGAGAGNTMSGIWQSWKI